MLIIKMDGAFYSYVSMLIDGNTGILNINSSTYEGLDTELHLQIDGGYVNIVTQDDGINVNEDHISVFTLNDGHVMIFAGQGAEGDVVDSMDISISMEALSQERVLLYLIICLTQRMGQL